MPKTKSLFYSAPNCGLPIGNLTSQIFSNVYLNDFDKFVKNELQIKYYGRYVDDFVLIHNKKTVLLKAKESIKYYLAANCNLTLHPQKIYFQHYAKGVAFLGAYIKPYRNYIGNRAKRNFYEVTQNLSCDTKQTRAQINSYFGIMQHFKTFNIRRKAISRVPQIFEYGYFVIKKGKMVFRLRKTPFLNYYKP